MRWQAPDLDPSAEEFCVRRTGRLLRPTELYRYFLRSIHLVPPPSADKLIGFVRYGNASHSGLACVLSNAGPSRKKMFVGTQYMGSEWIDILDYHHAPVVIDKRGCGSFPVGDVGASVWVEAAALERRGLQKDLCVSPLVIGSRAN